MDKIYPTDTEYYVGENVKSIIVFNKSYKYASSLTYSQIKLILRHELGHAIGLRHTFDVNYGETEPGIIALMHPSYLSSYASLTFTNYDISELNAVYP